jgi:hypothetical protein
VALSERWCPNHASASRLPCHRCFPTHRFCRQAYRLPLPRVTIRGGRPRWKNPFSHLHFSLSPSSPVSSTRNRLASIVAHHLPIPSAYRKPKTCWSFCPNLRSSGPSSTASTTELGTTTCHPPVRAHLRATRHWWLCLAAASCSPRACAATMPMSDVRKYRTPLSYVLKCS